MRKIHVAVSRPYDVLIGQKLLSRIPELIEPVCSTRRVLIVTDETVAALYASALVQRMRQAGFDTELFSFPGGERSKNMKTLSDILEYMAAHHFMRNDTVLALGGGVVGDTAGFAAAVYMRGVSVIQVPTTLLSAVDASVGGKTAVDLKSGKNLAGVFWQPRMVICDVDVMERLPADIFREGMAEVIKCNVIQKLPIIDRIRGGTLMEHLEETIGDCISLKRDIVEMDEFDSKGIRNVLNAGHTVGHAIEKLSNYTLSHGQAVGTGLITEAEISRLLGLCDQTALDSIRYALERFHLAGTIPWSADQLVEAMKSDKKNRDDRIVFELPREIGRCEEIRLGKEDVSRCLRKIQNRAAAGR